MSWEIQQYTLDPGTDSWYLERDGVQTPEMGVPTTASTVEDAINTTFPTSGGVIVKKTGSRVYKADWYMGELGIGQITAYDAMTTEPLASVTLQEATPDPAPEDMVLSINDGAASTATRQVTVTLTSSSVDADNSVMLLWGDIDPATAIPGIGTTEATTDLVAQMYHGESFPVTLSAGSGTKTLNAKMQYGWYGLQGSASASIMSEGGDIVTEITYCDTSLPLTTRRVSNIEALAGQAAPEGGTRVPKHLLIAQ